jgi:hypothetical protein
MRPARPTPFAASPTTSRSGGRTEEAINEHKQQLQAAVHANELIMENSRDVICTIDEAGRFLTRQCRFKGRLGL